MEKKTIGKFISALRKANGMTQKELGDRLYVSDKTVSRWECDECLPDLSLIPAIAEIFGITTDELLRGERARPSQEATASENTASRQKAKSDKQFRWMLREKSHTHQIMSAAAVGITVFGLIAAAIANLGFSKGLIAFCLAVAFCVAAELSLICFSINAYVASDDDDNDDYAARKQAHNTETTKIATVVSFVNLLAIAFCLPLVTVIDGVNYGLTFTSWLGFGLLFAASAFVVLYLVYALFVRKLLCKRGLMTLSEKQMTLLCKNRKSLIKTLSIAVAAALVLIICFAVWDTIGWDISLKEYTFDTCDAFKAFMEGEYDAWYTEGYSYVDENGNVVISSPLLSQISQSKIESSGGEKEEVYYLKKVYGQICNAKGEVICEYYYNPDLYKDILFTESADDKMPVTVIAVQSYYDAYGTVETVSRGLYALIAIDFIAATCIYLIISHKNKKESAA